MTDREEWRPEQCPVCGDPYANLYEAEEDPEAGESTCVDDGTAYVHRDAAGSDG